jgi:serine/threonine-protein kinase
MNGKIEIIKSYISRNETAKALTELKQMNILRWENEAVLIESRHNKVKEQIRLNIISFQEANLEEAKINNAILEICNEILAAETNNPNASFRVFEPAERKKGEIYGNYRIIEYIGSGGFGNVYKAEHNYLPRIVALKIAHEFEDRKGIIKHLIDYSLRVLSKLTHPNIVQVVDAGFSEGRYFIATDFVEGINLRTYFHQQVLDSPAEFQNRLIIFDKICKGIEYCHNTPQFMHGFRQPHTFHGDIKPENIIVQTRDNEPIITDFMMLDFDKVYQIDSLKPIEKYSDNLTAAFGTPNYMAEEQRVEGIITEQTEVYSLGVLFVELLNIPNQLQWVDRKALKIIDKATARNPEDRFINVKAMREELNKLIEF